MFFILSGLAVLPLLAGSGSQPAAGSDQKPSSAALQRAAELSALGASEDPDAASKIKRALSDDEWYVRGHAAVALARLRSGSTSAATPDDLEPLLLDNSWFVRAAAVEGLAVSEHPGAGVVLARLLDPADPYLCSKAAVALGHLRYAASAEALIKLLGNEVDPIKRAAAGALGRLKEPRAVDPLVALLKDQSVETRAMAAVALGAIGEARARGPVEEAAEIAKKEDPDSSWQYAGALYRLGNHDGLALVAAGLKSDYADIRLAALGDLVEFADPNSIPALVDAATPSRDSLAAPELIQAELVFRVKVAASLSLFDDDRARQALSTMLGDPNPGVRASAVSAIAKASARFDKSASAEVGPRRAALTASLDSIVRMLRKEQSPLVLAAIMKSIVLFDRDAASDALLGTFEAGGLKDPNIQQALSALGVNAETASAKLSGPDLNDRVRAAETLGRLGDPRAVGPLVDTLKTARETKLIVGAARALGMLGDRRAVGPLIASSHSEDVQVRTASIAALGRLGDDAADDTLFAAARDKEPVVREAAVESLARLGISAERLAADASAPGWQTRAAALGMLARLGGAQAVSISMGALADPDERVRAESARGLGVLGDQRAVDALIPALKDRGAEVRYQAAVALGRFRDSRAIAPLTASLADNDSRVSAAAAESLARMQDPAAFRLLLDSLRSPDWRLRARAAQVLMRVPAATSSAGAVPPLVEALRDKDLVVRYYAAEALVAAGAPAVAQVAELMRTGRYIEQERAARVLGRIGPPAVDSLIKLVQDRNAPPETRAGAARILGVIGDRRAVDPLLGLLRDERYFVRQQGARALGRIGNPAIDSLVQMARSSLPAAREAAIEALGSLYLERGYDSGSGPVTIGSPPSTVLPTAKSTNTIDPRALETIAAGLKDPSPMVQAAAVRALGETGSERAAELLMGLLRDESSPLRAQASSALGKIGKAGLPRLIAALKDPRPSVRALASEALGEQRSGDSVLALVDLVTNDSSAARAAGVEALGKIGAPAGLNAILLVMRTGSVTVRRKSIVALIHFPDPRVVDALIFELGDKDDEARQAAASALGEVGDERALAQLERVADNDSNADVRSASVSAIERLQARLRHPSSTAKEPRQ
jgi:HEAT repeat protein